ncbi:hypothetical protein GQX74_011948 [Glossina fuscipes]|nr:hypothetical protein GQX74_011948 [Glossina fuscipes]
MEANEIGIELGFLEKIDGGWLSNRYFPNKVGGKPAWLHLDDLPAQEKMICKKCEKPKAFLLQPAILPKEHKLCLACGCKSSVKCDYCEGYYCSFVHRDLHKPVCSKIGGIESCDRLSIVEFDEWEIVKDSMNDEEDITEPHAVEEQKFSKAIEELSKSCKTLTFQNLPDSDLEKYAANSELMDDKFFFKFRKECNKEPEQIIRYKRNGLPLWITDVQKTVASQLKEIPLCEYCGGERKFEFQIMPQLLNYLNDDGIDWGTLAIYTCSRSCPLPVGYAEEFVIKQDIIADIACGSNHHSSNVNK